MEVFIEIFYSVILGGYFTLHFSVDFYDGLTGLDREILFFTYEDTIHGGHFKHYKS